MVLSFQVVTLLPLNTKLPETEVSSQMDVVYLANITEVSSEIVAIVVGALA